MAYAKTWVLLGNQQPTIQNDVQSLARSFWLQLVALLTTSGGWTILNSSDGAAFGVGDKWLNDPVKLNWNIPSLARSHITLKSPIGIVAGLDGTYLGDQSRLWLTIDMNATNATLWYNCSIVAHTTAPTGGSTTAVPTSVNSISYPSSTLFLNGTAAASKFHFGVVSAGENVGGVLKGAGAFYAFVTNATMNGITSVFSLLPVTNYKQFNGKDHAYAIGLKLQNATSLGQICSSNVASGTNFYSDIKGWTSTGGATTYLMCSMLGLINVAATTGIGVGETGSGNIGGLGDSAEIWLYNPNAGSNAIVGSLADFSFTGATLSAFTVDTFPTVTSCYLIGTTGSGLWIPANTTLTS
jgi:hypothetical protein